MAQHLTKYSCRCKAKLEVSPYLFNKTLYSETQQSERRPTAGHDLK